MISIKSKYCLISAFLLLILFSGCGLVNSGGNDEEVDLLRAQLNALATQNAVLMADNQEQTIPDPPGQEPSATNTPPMSTSNNLPTEPVPAGVPIIFDGWSLVVSRNFEIETLNNGTPLIFITMTLKNLGMDNRVFRFSNAALSLTDDTGNQYPYFPGYAGNNYNCEPEYYTLKNLTVEGEDSVRFESHHVQCNETKRLTAFEGPIPLEASQIILGLTDFGPFTGVEILIDL